MHPTAFSRELSIAARTSGPGVAIRYDDNMIRKAILSVSTLAAVALGFLNFADYSFSWYHRDRAERVVGSVLMELHRGALVVTTTTTQDHKTPNWPTMQMNLSPLAHRVSWLDLIRKKIHSQSGPAFTMVTENQVNLGFLFVLFGAYPAVAYIRGPVRRWRRRKKGLCVKCAYDLTGNVSGACPECGTAISEHSTANT
ncbi:MAG: hypothetical protein ACYTFA_04845 [Planctomycetota bacterium]|jgi:hypothetical protein